MMVVMDPETDRQAAIAALQSWKESFDRRNEVVYQAHLAGLSLNEIRTETGLAINTIRSAISSEREKNMTAKNDPLAPYHHPHFMSVGSGRWTGEFKYTFKPFTGLEPRPEVPDTSKDDKVSWDDYRTLSMEYRAATEAWAEARFHRKARPVVSSVLPKFWDDYTNAMSKLERAFDDLQGPSEVPWHSRVMGLTFLRDAVESAAKVWDREFRQVADMYEEYDKTVGEEFSQNLEHLISGYGVDVKKWHKLYNNTSWGYTGNLLQDVVDEVIREQDKRIQEVNRLAG